MWRRTYALLMLLRFYFAISPSYLHPDEIFQGPEIIAGSLFPFPSHKTWEWTSDNPIRSVFPLWLFYGLPLNLFKNIWGIESPPPSPNAIYYLLRLVMLALSFVLEDWAIYELVPSPRHRSQALMLVASSYVTWTFQTHTFSNSIETLLVLWSLVLINRIDRIVKREHRTSFGSCFILGFLVVLGFFNRITFPAFVFIPGIRLLPHFENRPFLAVALSLSVAFWAIIAIAVDTAYYTGPPVSTSIRALYASLKTAPVITPLNNIDYNSQSSNLAQHGLHPLYQHVLVNVPQLLGPALLLLLNSITFTGSQVGTMLQNPRLSSALTGIAVLSVVPHQELRFLLPCVPLLLTCVELPRSKHLRRLFWASWLVFNIVLGVIMGVYHQGGIIQAQNAMRSIVKESFRSTRSRTNSAHVFWWKTYPPPEYLLGAQPHSRWQNEYATIITRPVMGLDQESVLTKIYDLDMLPRCYPSGYCDGWNIDTADLAFLVAPYSAWRLEDGVGSPPDVTFDVRLPQGPTMRLTHLATFPNHINLDDLDLVFEQDKIMSSITRAIERRGLGVWRVQAADQADYAEKRFCRERPTLCTASEPPMLAKIDNHR